MATFNSTAVPALLIASSPPLYVWATASDINLVLLVAPTTIAPVWPPSSNAPFIVVASSLLTTPVAVEAVRVVEGESGVAYRMRGYDTTLGREVFWSSLGIDSMGSGYGGPGPLVDIVVHMLLGT